MYAWNNGMTNQGDKSHCSADPSQHKSTTTMDIFNNACGSLHPKLLSLNYFPKSVATGTANY